jgi:hypothetical protein
MLATNVSTGQNEDEIVVEGYLKKNYINTNRVIHLTGVGDFNLKSIETTNDPCPLKAHYKGVEADKEKISSRISSRASSRRASIAIDDKKEIEEMMDLSKVSLKTDSIKGSRVLQTINSAEADSKEVVGIVDPFAAEQTWPTKEEMRAAKENKNKTEEVEDNDMVLKEEVELEDDLINKLGKMQIEVVGKIEGKDTDSDHAAISDEDENSEEDYEDILN